MQNHIRTFWHSNSFPPHISATLLISSMLVHTGALAVSGITKIVLVNTSSTITGRLHLHFNQLLELIDTSGVPTLQLYNDSIEQFMYSKTDSLCSAVATPANSLSYMGGGFDKYLLEALSMTAGSSHHLNYKLLERPIQNETLRAYSGYIPTKTSILVDLPQVFRAVPSFDYRSSLAYTNHAISKLIFCPTMVIPQRISSDNNFIFDCIWNILLTVQNHNRIAPPIETLILPAFGTGYGGLDIDQTARLIVAAIVIFHLNIDPPIRKSLLVLFLLKKDYHHLENSHDINHLQDFGISEYGIKKMKNMVFDDKVMEWQELVKCVDFL